MLKNNIIFSFFFFLALVMLLKGHELLRLGVFSLLEPFIQIKFNVETIDFYQWKRLMSSVLTDA